MLRQGGEGAVSRGGLTPKGGKRPRQESNLVYDLRTVACVPAHSKDVLREYPSEESNLVLQSHNLPCGPLHSQGVVL